MGDGLGQVTELLRAMQAGDKHAEESLLPLVYEELRVMARRHLRGERPNHTLQTTALVHEVYLRMAGNDQPVTAADRTHFFALAARMMRRILVDHARSRRSAKRGGNQLVISIDEVFHGGEFRNWETILSVHEALSRLEQREERSARVVELRFFSGLELEEIAQLLGVSSRTVRRDWQFAQAWLYNQLATKSSSEQHSQSEG